MKVPFLALKDITDQYADEIHNAVNRVSRKRMVFAG